MSEAEIRQAVEAARHRLPNLAASYADQAIASGKTVTAVKADLLDQTLGVSRARASMVSEIAKKLGSDAAAATAMATTPRHNGIDRRNAPLNAAEPKPMAQIDGRAIGRSTMLAEMAKQGIKPHG